MNKGVIIAVVIVVILIAAAWWYANYSAAALRPLLLKEGYPPSNHALRYATLGTISSQPLFEPDAIRKCSDGAYMYTDNPQMMSFCSSMPTCALKSSSCGCGLIGRPPYHVAYTQPSCVSCDKPQCASACDRVVSVPKYSSSCCSGGVGGAGTIALINGVNGMGLLNNVAGTNGVGVIAGSPSADTLKSTTGNAIQQPNGGQILFIGRGSGGGGCNGCAGGGGGGAVTCDKRLFVPALTLA